MARTPTSRSTLAFTEPQSRAGRGLRRAAFRFQAVLFFPLLLLEAASLHVASTRALATRGPSPGLGGRAAHRPCGGLLPRGVLLLSPDQGSCVHPGAAGPVGPYLGVSFASNHKGMPILDATNRSGFLRRQVLTSRNVRGGWLTDLGLGGLN